MSSDTRAVDTMVTIEPEEKRPKMQVAGEQVTITKSEALDADVDIHERDPNVMNNHVKVRFGDIFAEPDTELFSFDNVWICAFKTFTNTKLWCYRITSLLCAVPLSFCWGVYFALLAFCNIWICLPCLKGYEIELNCVRNVWTSCTQTFVEPCFVAIGKVFYNIRFYLHRRDE